MYERRGPRSSRVWLIWKENIMWRIITLWLSLVLAVAWWTASFDSYPWGVWKMEITDVIAGIMFWSDDRNSRTVKINPSEVWTASCNEMVENKWVTWFRHSVTNGLLRNGKCGLLFHGNVKTLWIRWLLTFIKDVICQKLTSKCTASGWIHERGHGRWQRSEENTKPYGGKTRLSKFEFRRAA